MNAERCVLIENYVLRGKLLDIASIYLFDRILRVQNIFSKLRLATFNVRYFWLLATINAGDSFSEDHDFWLPRLFIPLR